MRKLFCLFIAFKQLHMFQDDIQKKDLQKINHDLNEKLDRTELDALRDYMDKQMKKLKKLAVSLVMKVNHVLFLYMHE